MRKIAIASLFTAPLIWAGAVFAQQEAGTVVKAEHGAWKVVCAADNSKACLIGQTGLNEQKEPVLQVRIRKTPGAKGPQDQPIDALVELIAPIGVFLPAGIAISIDGREIGRGAYQVCNPEACLVAEPVQNDFINQLKKGANAVMTLTAQNGSRAQISISLSGFTKAYNSL